MAISHPNASPRWHNHYYDPVGNLPYLTLSFFAHWHAAGEYDDSADGGDGGAVADDVTYYDAYSSGPLNDLK